jgi:hypothetical protein
MRFLIAEGGFTYTDTLGQLRAFTRGSVFDAGIGQVPPGWTIPPDSGAFLPMDQQALQQSIAAQRAKTGDGRPPPGIISLADPVIWSP